MTRHDRGSSPALAIQSWPAATIVVIVAIAAGFVLPRLEVDHHWSIGFSADASTAVAILTAIAASLLTLLGFVLAVFTLMVQTVQAQSPRLPRVFARDQSTPLLFAVFAGSFAFAIIVLSGVRSGRVPTISVTVAIALVLVSVGLALRLLLDFRSTLSTGGLARNIGRETAALIDRRFREPYRAGVDGRADQAGAPPPADWTVLHHGPPGILQDFDEQGLRHLATTGGGTIRVEPAIGDFIATGATLATGTGPEPAPGQLARRLSITPGRTFNRDLALGLRLLADISIRALSPGINDPTSAVQALDQLDNLLRLIGARSLGSGQLADTQAVVRVVYPAPSWPALLGLAVDETIQYGASSLQVARRLRALLTDLLETVPDERRVPVRSRLDALDRAVTSAFPDVGRAEAMSADRQGLGSPGPRQ